MPDRAAQCADYVADRRTPGMALRKKSLHASELDAPRVRQARTVYCPRRTALDLQRLQLADEGAFMWP